MQYIAYPSPNSIDFKEITKELKKNATFLNVLMPMAFLSLYLNIQHVFLSSPLSLNFQ